MDQLEAILQHLFEKKAITPEQFEAKVNEIKNNPNSVGNQVKSLQEENSKNNLQISEVLLQSASKDITIKGLRGQNSTLMSQNAQKDIIIEDLRMQNADILFRLAKNGIS